MGLTLWYLKLPTYALALAGDPFAQTTWARHLLDQDRTAQGIVWLKRAAAAEVPEAQAILADHYMLGRGVPLDHPRALELALAAAHADEPFAVLLTALLYDVSPGLQDPELARGWYLAAENYGVPGAAERLAELEAQANLTPKPTSTQPD